MKKEIGSLLIESIVIVTIVAILAIIALPNINELLLRRDVESARDTIVQSLRLARQQAQSENTRVTVTIANRVVSISSQNNNNGNRTVVLPDRVQVTPTDSNGTLTLNFSAIGAFNGLNSNIASRTIIIRSTGNITNPIQERVDINAIGNIAGI